MLEWLAAFCVLILVVFICPGTKYLLGLDVSPRRLGVSRQVGCKDVRSVCAGGAEGTDEKGGTVALICKPSALAKYLQKHCRTFSRFSPSSGWTWRANAFLQSAYEACWPWETSVQFVRDNLQLNDDGLVSLDWAVSSHHRRRRTSSHSTSPVLLIIPNSFGKITRNVIKLCESALSHGYLPAVFNRRSHNGTPLTTLKLQQFGDPSDLREAVRYIRYRQPAGRLYAVSESSGSGLLLSYLGECGSSSYMTAAVCLSPVFRCQSWFENGLSWPLQWVLALYQKICLSRYRTALGDVMETDALFSSCSLRGVEEALFCQSGYSGSTSETKSGFSVPGAWDAYWERNEPLRDVDEVAIPVLSVCAKDDPIRGDAMSSLPLELFETNPHFFLLLTDRGGHCGFSTESDRSVHGASSAVGSVFSTNMSREDSNGTKWSHKVMLEFFRATTDFFNAEERAKQLAARRRGLGGASGGRSFRYRSVSTCKQVPACSHNIHAIYNWQRSYTR
ncbi:PREDICTED: abhydrolase domain-containing protein 15-like [Cyprinodon variegatus]|uniref:Protein ABHD15 n=1 Tax=Cyprinodon variegatus TaxID=28743 RepID=A0A3Q2CSF0_CYPVA|nr:PREDICTED: abhydrolase domain-containing protein 15-like [Cyprinodon variegatus]